MYYQKFVKQIHSIESQISHQLIEQKFSRVGHVHNENEHILLILENDMKDSKQKKKTFIMQNNFYFN